MKWCPWIFYLGKGYLRLVFWDLRRWIPVIRLLKFYFLDFHFSFEYYKERVCFIMKISINWFFLLGWEIWDRCLTFFHLSKIKVYWFYFLFMILWKIYVCPSRGKGTFIPRIMETVYNFQNYFHFNIQKLY